MKDHLESKKYAAKKEVRKAKNSSSNAPSTSQKMALGNEKPVGLILQSSILCTEVWMTIVERGWNLWVCLVGVVSRRQVWLVGGNYGCG